METRDKRKSSQLQYIQELEDRLPGGERAELELAYCKNPVAAFWRARAGRTERAGGNGRAASRYLPDNRFADRERAWVERIKLALAREEFKIYYQPIVQGEEKLEITWVEALLHWPSPDLGMIYPDKFIPAAEKSGLILPLGEWVLSTACAQVRDWQRAGHCRLKLAVNVSPLELEQEDFVARVERILAERDFDPQKLILEVTESVAVGDFAFLAENLSALREMGIGIALDDIGTRCSSLEWVKKLPANILKIDPAFVLDIEEDAGSKAIVAALLDMAAALGLEVVAEGVASSRKLELLHKLGCRFFQGNLFSPPVPAGDFAPLLGGLPPADIKGILAVMRSGRK